MKRFYTIFALLICFAAVSWADTFVPDATKVYTIKSSCRGYWKIADDGRILSTRDDDYMTSTSDAERDDAGHFAFITDDDGTIYLYAADKKQFLANVSSGSTTTLIEEFTTSTELATVFFEEATGSSLANLTIRTFMKISETSTLYYNMRLSSSILNVQPYGYHLAADAGCVFSIDEVEGVTFDPTEAKERLHPTTAQITYNCVTETGGEVLHTVTTTVKVGNEYPTLPDFAGATCTSGAPTGVLTAAEDKTYELVYTLDDELPVLSCEPTDENATWYVLNLATQADGTYNVMIGSYSTTAFATTIDELFERKTWFCFSGSPLEGYTIYSNKTDAYPGVTDNTYPGISGEPGKWLITGNKTDGYCIKQKNGNLYWTQSGNGIYEGQTGARLNIRNSRQTAQVLAEKTLAAHSIAAVEGKVGGYDAAHIAAYKQYAENGGEGMSTEFKALYYNNGLPEAGKFYHIACKAWEGNGQGFLDINPDGNKLIGSTTSRSDFDQIWLLVESGNGYKIKQANGDLYIGALSGEGTALADADNASVFTMTLLGDGNLWLRDGNNNMMHCGTANDGQAITFYNSTEAGGSKWYITPATEIDVTMNTADGTDYYTTLYAPFGVASPASNVTFYTGKVSDDAFCLQSVEDDVPAGNGVILKGSSEVCTLAITYTTGTLEDNQLTGTLAEKAIGSDESGNYYVLGAANNVVGLYHPAGTALLANKAYLSADNVPAVAGVQGLKFSFGEVTGIESLPAANADADAHDCYDLSGRRVAQPARGIYVKGGKKIFVR